MSRGDFPEKNGLLRLGRKSVESFLAAVFISGLQVLAPTQTFAGDNPDLPMASKAAFTSGPAIPTAAWSRFCKEAPSECSVNTNEPASIKLTSEIWRDIVQVNLQVNKTILAVTDADHWGVIDRWDFPDDGMGDCEDIQLLKRRLLVQSGLPHRAMRMTVVVDELGEGHAVMMIRTDHGDFVLDNKRDQVLAWEQTGYTYVKRENSDLADWVYYSGVAEPMVTANR